MIYYKSYFCFIESFEIKLKIVESPIIWRKKGIKLLKVYI